ncbi:transcriptional regulator, DeoR family [Palleronia marisminoris]|uniref:Glycerol-3-phosphate regulon repressor n=1 Tax=Palleronia marisminoris TaxID=315423 RepID=A0A1Y5R7E1_9RHOB|nr:DeoR/GlpR family DNA-binding transcription regulator [Palleronia marisminoris]SFG06743.1 transcriptional regulator, DeoR family [Palleronia marisminoris]SLN10870.1 Glycerol-3-phosphate regulon repressor [Palleronia marisminoris]
MTEASLKRRLKKGERREQILLELRLAPHVRVTDLAERLGVTTETIRRDIDELGSAGLLDRSFGGASARAPGAYQGLTERSRERVEERRRLAAHAAAQVDAGASLMIDAGSTTVEFARALATTGWSATVVTNSLQVATILGSVSGTRVVLAPGEYRNGEAAVVGAETCEFLARFNVDACYLGAAGLSGIGATEVVDGFAAIKRTMRAQAHSVNFLIDSRKFGRTHLLTVATPAEVCHLFTDAPPDDELAAVLRDAGTMISTPG